MLRNRPNFAPPDVPGSAAPAPPSAPAPDPSPAPSSAPADDLPSFEGLGGFDDEVEIESLAPGAAEASSASAAEAAPAASPAPAVPAPAPAAAQPAPKQPAATEPPAPAAPAKEPAQAAPPQEPVPASSGSPTLVEQLAQNRDALIGALASERFALSKEDTEALESDYVAAIPKLLAKVYYEAATTTLNHINTLVPRLIHQQVALREQQRAAAKAFYSQFPAIDQSKFGGDVAQFANLYRTANPSVTREDLFAMIGAAVMAKHGLTAPSIAPMVNGATPPRPASPAPFVPARPGTVVRTTPEPENPFEGLGQDFD